MRADSVNGVQAQQVMIFKRRLKQDSGTAKEAVDTPVMSEDSVDGGLSAVAIKPTETKKKKEKKPKKAKKEKSAKSIKSVKLSKKNQYVLTVGDEGAILVHFDGKGVEGRWFAANASDDNTEVLSKALAANPKAPLTIVLDIMDQHYSQQTLPPVNKMSVGGLLKRRASREFGRSMELQGNYLLSRSDSKEWNYMLFAIEIGEHVQAWFDWALTVSNPSNGIRVLSLEVGSLIGQLAKSQASTFLEEQQAQKEWQYFVTYNKVSGVRQVILRNGQMIFTRLGQPLEGDAQTEAGAIEQEIISTVEYLKRIGLKTIHDLQLYVVVAEDIMEVIDEKRMGVEACMLLSPHRVCNILGWDNVAQPQDRFGDVMLSVFVASSKKVEHKLWIKPLQQIKQLHMAVPVVRLLGVLASLSAIVLCAMSAYNYWEHSGVILDRQSQKNITEQEYKDMEAKVDLPPEELQKILETFALYKQQREQQVVPRVFLLQTSKAMDEMSGSMLVQSITWQVAVEGQGGENTPHSPMVMGGVAGMTSPGTQAAPAAQSGDSAKPKMSAPSDAIPQSASGSLSINLFVPSNIKREAMQATAEELVTQLSDYYPYYTFALQSIPETKSVTDSIDIDFNSLKEELVEQRRVTIQLSFVGIEFIPKPVFKEGS